MAAITAERRFWKGLVLWSGGLVAAMVGFTLLQFVALPGPRFEPGRFLLTVVEGLPLAVATLLPFAAYAAGTLAGDTTRAAGLSFRPTAASIARHGLAAAILTLLLFGFLGPWLQEAMTYDSARAVRHQDTGAMTLLEVRSTYLAMRDSLQASGTSAYDVLAWQQVNGTGWRFHAVLATSTMTILTTMFGFFVGFLSAAPGRKARWLLIERWTIGLLLFVFVIVFVVLGAETTEQRNISPASAAWLPLLAPLVGTAALGWAAGRSGLVRHGQRSANLSAGEPAEAGPHPPHA